MFRFTIRDVLWLMVVVGLGCGWWMERRKAAVASYARYDVKRLVTLLHERGYRVMWDDELGTMHAIATDPHLPHATEAKRRPDRLDLPDYMRPFSR